MKNIKLLIKEKFNIDYIIKVARLIVIIILIVAMIGVTSIILRLNSKLTSDNIDNLITSFDKTQGSIKRLADYAAVTTREANLTMTETTKTMKSVNSTVQSLDNLIKTDIANAVKDLKTEAKNTSLVAQATTQAINTINTVVGNDIPKTLNRVNTQIDNIGNASTVTINSLNKSIEGITLLTADARIQLNDTGRAVTELINNGNQLIVPEGKIYEVLKELEGTMHGINIITNDPSIKDILADSSINMKNLAGITSNIVIVSEETAKLSKHLTEKIIGTPPKNFGEKLLRVTVTVLKTVGAFGQIIYTLTAH